MIHISTSIDGLLAMSDYQLRKICKYAQDTEDGHQPTLKELKNFLNAEKAMGHKLLPAAGCTNFDPVLGCLCHRSQLDEGKIILAVMLEEGTEKLDGQ